MGTTGDRAMSVVFVSFRICMLILLIGTTGPDISLI